MITVAVCLPLGLITDGTGYFHLVVGIAAGCADLAHVAELATALFFLAYVQCTHQ